MPEMWAGFVGFGDQEIPITEAIVPARFELHAWASPTPACLALKRRQWRCS